MEFVKGRIITDPGLAELTATDRRAAWFSLVSTLAWLHSIDPDAIGLSGFGKKTAFYTRHCNTFSRIEAQQSQVRDIQTGTPLGRAHASFDEIVAFIRQNAPRDDRAAIVHGDYKFDNVVLHPTEPRVIAILDWELSTIGHPLVDAVYVVAPFWNRAAADATANKRAPARDDMGSEVYDPENLRTHGLPSMDELLDRYAEVARWDPRQDRWEVAKVFHLMRVSASPRPWFLSFVCVFSPVNSSSFSLECWCGLCFSLAVLQAFVYTDGLVQGGTISHGIQARTITGQASSEFSHVYFENTKRSLDAALAKVREIKEKDPVRSNL